MRLYHHKTDGGAEYLTDKFIECDNGHREGIFDGARFIVRIDGDITKDAELSCGNVFDALEVLKAFADHFPGESGMEEAMTMGGLDAILFEARAVIVALGGDA